MEQRIEIERLEEAANLFGSFDENIRLIESEFHVVVTNRRASCASPESRRTPCWRTRRSTPC